MVNPLSKCVLALTMISVPHVPGVRAGEASVAMHIGRDDTATLGFMVDRMNQVIVPLVDPTDPKRALSQTQLDPTAAGRSCGAMAGMDFFYQSMEAERAAGDLGAAQIQMHRILEAQRQRLNDLSTSFCGRNVKELGAAGMASPDLVARLRKIESGLKQAAALTTGRELRGDVGPARVLANQMISGLERIAALMVRDDGTPRINFTFTGADLATHYDLTLALDHAKLMHRAYKRPYLNAGAEPPAACVREISTVKENLLKFSREYTFGQSLGLGIPSGRPSAAAIKLLRELIDQTKQIRASCLAK